MYENEHPNSHLHGTWHCHVWSRHFPLQSAAFATVGIPLTGCMNNYPSFFFFIFFFFFSRGFFFSELCSHTNSAAQHGLMWSYSSFIAGITEHFTADYKVAHAGNDMSCLSEVKLQAGFWAHPEDTKDSGNDGTCSIRLPSLPLTQKNVFL